MGRKIFAQPFENFRWGFAANENIMSEKKNGLGKRQDIKWPICL